MSPCATPFHSRTSALNRFNRWGIRNGFTLPLDFGDASAEALAARTRVAVGDISWRARAMLEGPTVAEMAARTFTRDPRNLAPGQSLKALWLNDGGAVRGAGAVSRLASDKFLVASAASDLSWFETAASLSGNLVRDVTYEEGGLSLIGPYAVNLLTAAGLPDDLAALELRKHFWRGLDITITRWGEQEGYELWCKADDCTILWDRIFRAGADFGIAATGVAASDVLDVEVGVARPGRDYLAANDGFAPDPTPASLSLDKLIDVDHAVFNGRIAWLAARETNESVIVGLEVDSETPASFCAISMGNRIVGTALTSVYSPALRRVLALARIEKSAVKPDASFTIVPQATLENFKPESITVYARELPFWRPASTVVG